MSTSAELFSILAAFVPNVSCIPSRVKVVSEVLWRESAAVYIVLGPDRSRPERLISKKNMMYNNRKRPNVDV